MKLFPFILLIALIGCGRSGTSNRALQMNQQIQQWIPKGTPVATGRQIMEQHQFVCVVGSYDSKAAMPPGSDLLWWNNGSFISKDGKTLPVTNVTLLTCTRTNADREVWAYETTLTAVDGEFDGRYNVSAWRLR